MKKMLLSFVFIFSLYVTNAQLANTSWKGTIDAGGQEFNVTFVFKTDSVVVINNDDQSTLDVSTFMVQDTTMTLTKVSGLSSCGSNPGKYKFVIKDKTITFTKLDDNCYDRYGALDGASFTKLEN